MCAGLTFASWRHGRLAAQLRAVWPHHRTLGAYREQWRGWFHARPTLGEFMPRPAPGDYRFRQQPRSLPSTPPFNRFWEAPHVEARCRRECMAGKRLERAAKELTYAGFMAWWPSASYLDARWRIFVSARYQRRDQARSPTLAVREAEIRLALDHGAGRGDRSTGESVLSVKPCVFAPACRLVFGSLH
jgi:hypothetical protein